MAAHDRIRLTARYRRTPPRRGSPISGPVGVGRPAVLRALLHVLGLGALIAGGVTVALAVIAAAILLGPLVFWLAWNVLDFAGAVGLPELGFWGIVLATLFLVIGWFGKVVIAGIVLLVDPAWFDGAAQVHWPEPTFRSFLAIALLAVLASWPHVHAGNGRRRGRR
jgi:hypothetical protein